MEPGTDSPPGAAAAKLTRDLSIYAPELIALARNREQYLKEIDRRQPISITRTSMEPLIRLVSERIMDEKPPGWLTIWRDYRKCIAAGRDVRAIILRHVARGKSGSRMVPDVQIVSDQVIEELYMATERKRVDGQGTLLADLERICPLAGFFRASFSARSRSISAFKSSSVAM
jgi:hypothetical protein